mgnify:CR=1 FL=1
MKEYEINEDTMAIIPINYYQTLVKEVDNDYIIDKKAYEVMEDSCEYYGSTYKGRLEATKKILNSSYKIPIIIEESENIIFFPSKSSLLEDCCWINYNFIKKYEKFENRVKITFKNNEEIEVDMSKLSLENQISRSSMLELISRKRKINKNDK